MPPIEDVQEKENEEEMDQFIDPEKKPKMHTPLGSHFSIHRFVGLENQRNVDRLKAYEVFSSDF